MSWSLPQRIGFRFLFAYLMAYTTQLFGLSRRVVPWTGAHALGLNVQAPVEMGGSGDKLFDWVQAFCVLAFALAATAVWSALDRKRPHYRTLHAWLRPWLRYGLGIALIGYGMAKIIQTQFPHPSPWMLDKTFGAASPMGLLWTFMGFSAGYNLFAGLAEAVPGLLLFYRRTALLGALLAAAVMANIVALNFFYDVPVKIFSIHLLLIAAVIAAPDLPRLVRLFLLNQPAPPADLSPAMNRPRVMFAWQFVKIALLAAMIGSMANNNLERQGDSARAGAASVLSGYYEVEEFRHGKSARWSSVTFDGEAMRPRTVDGSEIRYIFAATTSSLTLMEANGTRMQLEIRKPERGKLELSGPLSGEPLHVRLRKRSGGYRLEDRGFRWVTEVPFNR
jgi:hypothetical protein